MQSYEWRGLLTWGEGPLHAFVTCRPALAVCLDHLFTPVGAAEDSKGGHYRV